MCRTSYATRLQIKETKKVTLGDYTELCSSVVLISMAVTMVPRMLQPLDLPEKTGTYTTDSPAGGEDHALHATKSRTTW